MPRPHDAERGGPDAVEDVGRNLEPHDTMRPLSPLTVGLPAGDWHGQPFELRLQGEAKIGLEDDPGSSLRTMEESALVRSLVDMKRRMLLTTLAFGLLVLAVGGWLVQGVRWTPRLIAASVH